MMHSTFSRTSMVCLSLAMIISACSKPADETTAERPPVAVEVTKIAPGDLQESIAVVGTLAPKFQSEVKAEYSGVITDVYVTEWVRVAKGAVLARFDRRDSESMVKAAVAARMQAEVGATRAKRELDRTVQLKESGLATPQSLDDARTAYDAAQAQLGAAKAQEEMAETRLAKTTVTAPMDGVVASRTVNPGDFIQNMGSGDPMFRIVDNSRLELTVSVAAADISRVKLGQPLSFTTDAVPGRTFEGHVSFINPSADEASRAVKVVAVVENRDGALKSGLFSKGAIIVGHRAGVLRVPRSAMLTWDPAAKTGVLYVVNGDRAQRKSVSTGASSGDEIEIAGGLNAGETVVTRGSFSLREGDRVTVVTPTAALCGTDTLVCAALPVLTKDRERRQECLRHTEPVLG